ncbi:MAG: cellulase family glycosylhydrolase [Bacteroidales bacterium]|nr:cellulase family glycosylhydrolase [Bacteroidales bacterium]MCF8454964.1 cellulase family glycosylhydrolase [Bacteroidales bacterium]
MNKRLFLVLLSLLIIVAYPPLCLQAQFVELYGDEFRIEGEPFYPVVLNFSSGIIYNSSVSNTDFFSTPAFSYGQTNNCECNSEISCNADWITHLNKVKEMGFNTIRIGKPGPYIKPNPSTGALDLSLVATDVNNYSSHLWYDISFTDYYHQNNQKLYNVLLNILDLAQTAGLKVIYLVHDGYDDSTGEEYYASYDYTVAANWASYLGLLATALANHPALLGYDLINEPLQGSMHMQGVSNAPWTKEDCCNFVSMWCDAIKQNDPNHLVTFGGHGKRDLWYYDIGCLKLDFYSIHLYPVPRFYNDEVMMSARLNQLYWMNKVSTIPWIIGETGYSSDDNVVNLPVALYDYPYMYGDEDHQKDYAVASLEYCQNCGSGYSWWMYQNVHWYSESDPIAAHQNYFGLLRFGNNSPTWDTNEKDCVEAFRNFAESPPEKQPCTEPPYFYETFQPNTNTIYGYIKDHNLENVKHALVKPIWKYDHLFISGKQKRIPVDIFTNGNGYFSSNTPEITLPDPNYDDRELDKVEIGGLGYQLKIVYNFTNGHTYNIKRYVQFDSLYSNHSIGLTQTEQVSAARTLTVSDVTVDGNGSIGGEADFKALKSVKFLPGFHAKNGSNIHVHLGSSFPGCSNVPANAKSQLVNPSSQGSQNNNHQELKEIQLQFKPVSDNSFAIYPNPCLQYLSVESKNSDSKYTVVITDILGNELLRFVDLTQKSVIDLKNIQAGVYLIILFTDDKKVVSKIIKQ